VAGKKTIGVLALQGAFLEHQQILAKCGAAAKKVRSLQDVDEIDGLIIPGGESTTIGRLLVDYDLGDSIREKSRQGMPTFGTCAGMIVMAKEIKEQDQYRLALMDISVERNAFGRQVESFEADLTIKGMAKPVRGIFIRAPYVDRVWGEAEVLSRIDDKIVMVQQGNLLACSFHPELTRDLCVHRYFLNMV
jgi:5'-phosphate synthase pdxT subunit